MKKCVVVLTLLVAASSSVFAATETLFWRSTATDGVFMNAANWALTSPTGGTPVDALVGNDTLNITTNAGTISLTGTNSLYKWDLGASATANYTLNESGATTVANTLGLAKTAGSNGTLNVSGTHTQTGNSTLAAAGTATLNVNNGGSFVTATAGSTTCASAAGSNCTVGIQDGGEFRFGTGYFTIANAGTGTVNVSGSLYANEGTDKNSSRITIAQVATAVGNLNVSDGLLSVGRLALSQALGGNGTLKISGDSSVSVASATPAADAGLILGTITAVVGGVNSYQGEGTATLILEGSEATVNASRLTMGSNDTIKFVLDGANGVGTGIVLTYEMTLAGILDVSFDSTIVNGTYTLMTAASSTNIGMVLSEASQQAGWSYGIVDVTGGKALQVTIPEPATISLLVMGVMGLLVRRSK